MAKVRGTIKAAARKKPVKAGSTHTDTTGGIFTSKVIAIAKKRKNKK